MAIRLPAPLQPGDRIGVTSPSAGVPAALSRRLEVCLDMLRNRGYDVEVGACMDGDGIVSAPAAARAEELQRMLLDPEVRAIIPPWGGELGVEVLPHLDLEAIARAQPTWVIGYSDMDTLLMPLTTMTGLVTVHGQNLMDTPYGVPEPMLTWLDVASADPGTVLHQGAARQVRGPGFVDYATYPEDHVYQLDRPGGWRLLAPDAGPVRATGTLIGGCIETVSILAGTRFGDISALDAPFVVYLEASEDGAIDIARHLWRFRLAGWFDQAGAVLIGRTYAPDADGFTQADAVRSVLGDLDLPVILDVDCGHVPPQLSLLNGLAAQIVCDGDEQTITQALVDGV
ncbi:S66 family peptidase [Euzebya tangerina]|uniref:S66 family peptidase n=1 Tax=Euzebya tangerina TaxID=591198 RepID=UPI000E31ADA3|nr:S66 peptidase family protein [Euzebya tangerina]